MPGGISGRGSAPTMMISLSGGLSAAVRRSRARSPFPILPTSTYSVPRPPWSAAQADPGAGAVVSAARLGRRVLLPAPLLHLHHLGGGPLSESRAYRVAHELAQIETETRGSRPPGRSLAPRKPDLHSAIPSCSSHGAQSRTRSRAGLRTGCGAG